jgi:hypothetical protein
MDHSNLPIRGKIVAKSKRKFADWISRPGDFELTPFQQVTIDVDWENSPLGPMSGWSRQLRSIVLIVCADPLPVSRDRPNHCERPVDFLIIGGHTNNESI